MQKSAKSNQLHSLRHLEQNSYTRVATNMASACLIFDLNSDTFQAYPSRDPD